MNNVLGLYAQALEELALEENQNENYRLYLKNVKQDLLDNPCFITLLKSEEISKDEKKNIIDQVFISCPFCHIKNFFKVIIDNDQCRNIITIIDEFITLSNLHDGIVEGYLYTTETLSQERVNDIEKALGKKIKQKVYLKQKIDPSLIGGIKVVINDHVFDASYKNKLDQMKELLERNY